MIVPRPYKSISSLREFFIIVRTSSIGYAEGKELVTGAFQI